MKPLYTYPQETWDEAKCKKVAKSKKGLIASSSSSYAEYGQTVRFNGGCIREGEHYQSEHRPLPKVPAGWGFKQVLSWGTYLVRLNISI
jgi:hypothetical protein